MGAPSVRVEQGADIRVIKVLLGQVNINATGIYTQVSSKTMRAVTIRGSSVDLFTLMNPVEPLS